MGAEAAAPKDAEARRKRTEAESRRKLEEVLAKDERSEGFRATTRQSDEAGQETEKAVIEAQRIAIQQNINKRFRQVIEQQHITEQREAEERIKAARCEEEKAFFQAEAENSTPIITRQYCCKERGRGWDTGAEDLDEGFLRHLNQRRKKPDHETSVEKSIVESTVVKGIATLRPKETSLRN